MFSRKSKPNLKIKHLFSAATRGHSKSLIAMSFYNSLVKKSCPLNIAYLKDLAHEIVSRKDKDIKMKILEKFSLAYLEYNLDENAN